MNTLQQTVQTILDQSVEQNTELGVQATAYIDGKLAFNAHAGIADRSTGRKVDAETLFPIFSVTKGMAATLAHLAVERGQVAYETPIADVWPEFVAHGKETITLQHALNHTAGLQNMPVGIGHAELCDWDAMCAAIADLKPVSPPGMEYAYHAITYSWLVGEVVHRVDGRSFRQMLHDEICAPLKITDSMFVGIPDEAEPRVAVLEEDVKPDANQPAPSEPSSVPPLVMPLHEWMNRPDARRACIPASNGIMTAHAIARHYAALLPGGVDGCEILPPGRIRAATALQPRAGNAKPEDPPQTHRLGYMVGASFSGTSFGHGGYGGAAGFADVEHRLAFGFARNRYVENGALQRIVEAMCKYFGIEPVK